MLNSYVAKMFQIMADFGADYLVPAMIVAFIVGVMGKAFIYYIIRAMNSFSKGIEKRVHLFLDGDIKDAKGLPFHDLAKAIFYKNLIEVFDYRTKFQRRRLDYTASFLDRIFMIQDGGGRLVEDTLKHTKYIHDDESPVFTDVTDYVLSVNPYYNKLVGVFSIKLLDNLFNILPGIFIVAGIFGTFLGIVKGLPGLQEINPENAEQSRTVLNMFIGRMAFSMNTSLLGILFSIMFTFVNSMLNPRSLYFDSRDKLANSLALLFKESKFSKTKGETKSFQDFLNSQDKLFISFYVKYSSNDDQIIATDYNKKESDIISIPTDKHESESEKDINIDDDDYKSVS